MRPRLLEDPRLLFNRTPPRPQPTGKEAPVLLVLQIQALGFTWHDLFPKLPFPAPKITPPPAAGNQGPPPRPLSPARRVSASSCTRQASARRGACRHPGQSLTSSSADPASGGSWTSTCQTVRDPETAMNSPHPGAALPAPPATQSVGDQTPESPPRPRGPAT